MEIGTASIDTKKIVKQFAVAVQEQDFDLIASLLADDGEFNTQDAELNTLNNSNKAAFMKWVTTALSGTTISKIEYDQCLHCKIGNPVVLFNEGQFPPIQKELSSVSMTGLMLDIKDGQIREIAFCYTFLDRENKYQSECLKPKIDKLEAKGFPRLLAAKIILTEEGYLKEKGEGPVLYIGPDIK